MSPMFKTAVAASVAAGFGLVAVESTQAQWDYGYGTTRSHFHAPYGSRSFSASGSRYSLYGPASAPIGPTFGYQMEYPGYGFSNYAPAPVVAPPAYGYGAYTGPTLRAPRGKIEYETYGPRGKQEVEYKFKRDGSVHVDLDD